MAGAYGAGGGGSSGVNNNTTGGINSTNSKDAQGSRGQGLNAELQRFATLTEEAALMRSLPRGDLFYERERGSRSEHNTCKSYSHCDHDCDCDCEDVYSSDTFNPG